MSKPEGKPTLGDLLERTQRAHEDGRRGPLPGVVVSYDRSRQRAEIEVPVHVFVDGVAQPLPVLRSVPVIFPAGGGCSLTFDLEPGDPVYLVPAECDCSAWLARGLRGAPPTQRRSSPTDYVAIPGGPRTAPLEQVAQGALVLAAEDLRLGGAAASDYVALASLVLSELRTLRDWCLAHAHPAHGAVSSPPPEEVGEVGATKAKAL